MTDPIKKISAGTDLDAEYVLRRLALIEECEKDIITRREQCDAAMRESGERLIEVHAKRSQKNDTDKAASVTLSGTWRQWLEDNGINRETARRHMKFAGYTEVERAAEREKEATRKRESRAKQYRKGRNVLLADALGISERQASNLRDRNRAWFDPYPDYFEDRAAAQAFVSAVVAQFPITIPPADRSELAPTAQQKLDRAIARETDRLAGAFWTQVREQVQLELPEQRTILREAQEKINVEIDIWTSRNSHMDSLMTMDEYRLILSCLHPDRVPEADKEKYNKAFTIMRKLGDRLMR